MITSVVDYLQNFRENNGSSHHCWKVSVSFDDVRRENNVVQISNSISSQFVPTAQVTFHVAAPKNNPLWKETQAKALVAFHRRELSFGGSISEGGKGSEEVRTMKLVASRSTSASKRLRSDDGWKVNKSECQSALLSDELKRKANCFLVSFILNGKKA